MAFKTFFFNFKKDEQRQEGNRQSLPYYLVADYLNQPPEGLSDTNTCQLVRLIPPRETISDPAHLEAFFSTLASLITQAAGIPQFAGGRVSAGRAIKQQVRQNAARRLFLNEIKYEAETDPAVPLAQTIKSDQANIEENEDVATTHPAILARLKGLAKRYRPQWEHSVSLEIAGGYQQISFLLRVADANLLSETVQLLRQEYPHLEVEELTTCSSKVGRIKNRTTDASSPNFYSHQKQKHLNGEGLVGQHFYDPLALQGNNTNQRFACRWLVLSEHPAMPLALPGQPGLRTNSIGGNSTKASPLRRLMAGLSQLEPGEVACSQLLVFGLVSKEWVKAQETQLHRMATTDFSSDNARLGSGARPVKTPYSGRTSGNSSQPGPATDKWFPLIMLVAAAAILYYFVSRFFETNTLPPFLTFLLIALAIPGIMLGLLSGLMVWWPFRNRQRKGEILSLQAMETKLSSPLILAAIRQVVAVPFERCLRRVCNDPSYGATLERQGYSQARATQLYRIRQQWLQLQALSKSQFNFSAISSPDYLNSDFVARLAEVKRIEDEELWAVVSEIAEAEAEECCEQLLTRLASGYAGFGSITGNTFAVVPAPSVPAQDYSTLHPYDWPSPERLRRNGLESLWPFNTRLFDWLDNLGNPALPPEAKEHRGLQVFSALELSHFWHLPGGYEQLDFVERTGPKMMGPDPYLVSGSEPIVTPDNFYSSNTELENEQSPLFGLFEDER